MAGALVVKPRVFFSSFLGVGGNQVLKSQLPLHKVFNFNPGGKHVSMQFSRALSGITNLLFNRRNLDEIPNTKRKRLRPGKVSPRRPVPNHIPRPPYVNSRKPPGIASGHEVHDEKGIECMRASGRLAAQVLEYAGTLVKPGVMTDDIDQAVHQMIIDNGAYPSPLGYGGFPKSVCTSVNECICHGIPDSRVLEDGDIINIDVTVYLNAVVNFQTAMFGLPSGSFLKDGINSNQTFQSRKPWISLQPNWCSLCMKCSESTESTEQLLFGCSFCQALWQSLLKIFNTSWVFHKNHIYNTLAFLGGALLYDRKKRILWDNEGYHGDTSATFFCGDVDDEARNLVQVTKECLDEAISICAPGVEYKQIGKTIQIHADKHRFGVVQQYVGHGVGRVFHADPVILHYRNNESGRMVLNQTFTIEPMLTIGSINPVIWDDDWTVVTADGSLSAQFEHTILITNDGAEILTRC